MEKANNNQSVRAVPEGYHTVTPYLVVDNAQGLIDFIRTAFDGKEMYKMEGNDSKIMHAVVAIGDSMVMISDVMEGMPRQTAMLYLYLENADAVFRKAVDANAISIREPVTEFYGDRSAAVRDQWGNMWWIATHVEDVEPEEMEMRLRAEKQKREAKGDEVHA